MPPLMIMLQETFDSDPGNGGLSPLQSTIAEFPSNSQSNTTLPNNVFDKFLNLIRSKGILNQSHSASYSLFDQAASDTNQTQPHASAISPALDDVNEQHVFGNAEVELHTCDTDIAVTEEVISQLTDADFAILDNFQDEEVEEHAIEKANYFSVIS